VLLMGYGHAIERHGIDDPGRHLLQRFAQFLLERYGWADSRGPIWSIRAHTASDEEAWQLLWNLLRELRKVMSTEMSAHATHS
jgi:hypothetical protein